MTGGFTIPDGAVEGPRVKLHPGAGAQAIPLPGPQPWIILIAEAR